MYDPINSKVLEILDVCMSYECYRQTTTIKSIDDIIKFIINHQLYGTIEILNRYCPTRDDLMKYTMILQDTVNWMK